MKIKDTKILKHLIGLPVMALMILLAQCGGGGGGGAEGPGKKERSGPSRSPVPAPEQTPNPNAELEDLALNTFVSRGINITVDPTFINFGQTARYAKLSEKVTLTNGTAEKVTLNLTMSGTSGGFRLQEEGSKLSAYRPQAEFEAGESQELTIEFDASVMGTRTGYLEITASEKKGKIRLPFRATVSGPSDFRIIPSSYMCSNERAPKLVLIDFLRAASGRAKEKNFKICNTGGKPIRIDSIEFKPNTKGTLSQAMTESSFVPFNWDIEETITSALFGDDVYYYPRLDDTYTEPTPIDCASSQVNEPAAFSALEHRTRTAPQRLVIDTASYAMFDVVFDPRLDMEAPEDSICNPVSYAADMVVNVSISPQVVDVVGASGGEEPILSVSVDRMSEEGTTSIDNREIDLNSLAAAVDFGTVQIFDDWVTEDSNEITLLFKNNGTGAKQLEVWMEPIVSGYFTLVPNNPEVFPLVLDAGSEGKPIKLRYFPTPTTVSQTHDLGQAIIMHNGGNGPRNRLTLVGQQQGTQAVEISQDGIPILRNFVRSEGRTKRFCIFQDEATGDWSSIQLGFKNNSTLTDPEDNTLINTLISNVSVTIDSQDGITPATVDPRTTRVETGINGQEQTLAIRFTPNSEVEGFTGHISIANEYALEEDIGVELEKDFEIDFDVTVSREGACVGGTGQPLDGIATLVVDRFTMILGGVSQPAANPPSFKLHIPIKLDKVRQQAKILPITYDPLTSPTTPKEKKFQIHMHQGSNVNSCFPIPTNPYVVEDKPNSWNDTDTQCTHEAMGITDGSMACIPENGAQVTPDGTQVFYHEFVKFAPGTCDVEFEGKIATFHVPPGKTIRKMFDDVFDQIGPNGEEGAYQGFFKMFQFDSFIKFNVNYASGNCNVASGTNLTSSNPDAIRDCWESFKGDNSLRRAIGMMEECANFFITIHEGCDPFDENDMASPRCAGVEANNPDTWIGYGEYEPYVHPRTGDISDTKWDITVRNVHLTGNLLAHALNAFFANKGKHLFADLYATLTTKPIGGDFSGSPRRDWEDLIAVQNQGDFDEGTVFINRNSSNAQDFWMEDGVNSDFTTGGDDDVSCFDESGEPLPLTPCRGNFMFTSDRQNIMTAGEPVDFVNLNRTLLVGLSFFHGKGELAPIFAKEFPDGTGRPLYFTIHACLHAGEDISPDAGCYEDKWDDQAFLDEYFERGLITSKDTNDETGDPNAKINYKLFDRDRNVYVDYYDHPNHYKFTPNSVFNDNCFRGM